jgi:hypothetical protein
MAKTTPIVKIDGAILRDLAKQEVGIKSEGGRMLKAAIAEANLPMWAEHAEKINQLAEEYCIAEEDKGWKRAALRQTFFRFYSGSPKLGISFWNPEYHDAPESEYSAEYKIDLYGLVTDESKMAAEEVKEYKRICLEIENEALKADIRGLKTEINVLSKIPKETEE